MLGRCSASLEEDYHTLVHVLSEGTRPLTSGLLNVSLPGPRPLTSPARSPRLARLLRRSGRFVYYRRLVIVDHLAGLARGFRDKYDLIIETRSSIPLKWADVSYVHFPVMTDLMTIQGKRTGFPWRLYNWLTINKAKSMTDISKPVMTNSNWTAEHVRWVYGSQRVYVVHPPVNVEELSSIGGDRGRVVLTVSRIDWGKRVWEIPDIAGLVPEAGFYLVGSTGPSSKLVLNLLEERAKGLKNFK